MRLKSLHPLVYIVAGCLLLAAIVQALSNQASRKPDTLVFPTLATDLNDISHITIVQDLETLHLDRHKGRWLVRERFNQPANLSFIRSLMVNISQSLYIEPRTSDSTKYHKLGLDNQKAAHVKAFIHEDQEPVMELYIGNSMPALQGTYIRLPNDPQSWLVTGDLRVLATPSLWLEPQLANLPLEEIRELSIAPTEGFSVKLSRDTADDEFILNRIPKNHYAKDAIIYEDLISYIADIKSHDVAPEKRVHFGKYNITTTTISTFDGRILTLRAKKDKQTNQFWLKISASTVDTNNEDTFDWANQINSRSQDWIYAIDEAYFNRLNSNRMELVVGK